VVPGTQVSDSFLSIIFLVFADANLHKGECVFCNLISCLCSGLPIEVYM
jgi:hypothetical protein